MVARSAYYTYYYLPAYYNYVAPTYVAYNYITGYYGYYGYNYYYFTYKIQYTSQTLRYNYWYRDNYKPSSGGGYIYSYGYQIVTYTRKYLGNYLWDVEAFQYWWMNDSDTSWDGHYRIQTVTGYYTAKRYSSSYYCYCLTRYDVFMHYWWQKVYTYMPYYGVGYRESSPAQYTYIPEIAYTELDYYYSIL